LLKASTTVVALSVGIAASATVGLLAPVSESDITAANATITAYTGSVPPALEVPADPDFLKEIYTLGNIMATNSDYDKAYATISAA
jgi:hypothetical protein